MILKVLLVAVVIYIVYTMFLKPKKEPSSATEQQKNNAEVKADEMVECSECGLYVEISEAILSNGKYYCSQECIAEAKK